jgi:hypothetical protein
MMISAMPMTRMGMSTIARLISDVISTPCCDVCIITPKRNPVKCRVIP